MNNEEKIINGKSLADVKLNTLKKKLSKLNSELGKKPKLAIIQVGNNESNNVYINSKIKACDKVGIEVMKVNLPKEVGLQELKKQIIKLNLNRSVSGIIVQQPLPKQIVNNEIISAIDPLKDVDGFHPYNVGCLNIGLDNPFVPCTAMGIVEIIKSKIKKLCGIRVVIVGRSNIVGKPLGIVLLKENCTVTICHSKTKNLDQITKSADIVVLAVGKPKIFGIKFFSKNSFVIDVGISKIDKKSKKIYGDVDFDLVSKKVRFITPVPGGVGPMTVAFLIENTIHAYYLQNRQPHLNR